MAGAGAAYRVGVDIGGTFTDLAFLDLATGAVEVDKVRTTTADPSVGVLTGIGRLLTRLGASGDAIERLVHGTTIVSNTLIEGSGATTGLMTTEGFRDVLEARNGKRYDLYDMRAALPAPLVPRRHRLGVRERIDNTGSVVEPLDEGDVRRAAQALVDAGVESVAVCLLHSYRNPDHELRVRDVVAEIAPGLPVSLSVEVAPQVREFPRTSTTVVNAYVQPKVARYLSRLEERLADFGFARGFYMMFSGGVTMSSHAKRVPVRIAESGPAAGAVAARAVGDLLGLDRVVSFDMGGTTAKICFIDDGEPTVTHDFEIARVHRFRKGSGHPIALPALDMIEIGAGGGSIAHVDDTGLLKVGPESAADGAGPACYDSGGVDATATDANLVLGLISADYFLGGEMPLSKQAAATAIDGAVAGPLGIDTADAARGIVRVVNENMANAARVYAAEKGRDLRRYTLVAFGGAGPAHACALADLLRIRDVVIPPAAGVMSAVGLLAAPLAFDFVRSYLTPLAALEVDYVNELFADMEAQAFELVRQAGVPEDAVSVTRSADMRYVGQLHEINVRLPVGRFDSVAVDEVERLYTREYERLYRRRSLGHEIEAVNWRVVVGTAGEPFPAAVPSPEGELRPKSEREVVLDETGSRSTPVYERAAIPLGAVIAGPAIVEEPQSTTVITAGRTATVDEHGNLCVRAQAGRS
jgi:N-methylhydantoinase A